MIVINSTIFVFIPNSLEKTNVGFLSGFVINKENQNEFYITKDKLNIDPTNCIGYCGMSTNKSKPNWIHINYYDETLKVNEITCDYNQNFHLIFIIYDYFTFKNSEIHPLSISTNGEHFNELSKALKLNEKEIIYCGFIKKLFIYIKYKTLYLLLVLTNFLLLIKKILAPLEKYSCIVSSSLSSVSAIQWALKSIIKERKVNLKVGNFVSSKLADVLIGLLTIFCFSYFQIDLSRIINSSAKELITNLQDLMKFLMGSPVGLKLNYGFNNALGNFFLYHISLWRTFLFVISPYMNTIFKFMFVFATFGFSFQTAIAADLLKIATFHVYCIYVYAARLYEVQIRALRSLWKLFIGRKQNPLRNRVDSCHYSHHQLFVGTLAFTILLFLLPTTMLYYFVFTILRLTLSGLDGLLKYLRRLILNLSLYVTVLWLLNSPKIKGCVYVEVEEQKRNSTTLTLKATLKRYNWWQCLMETQPPITEFSNQTTNTFQCLLRSIAVGDLI